MSAAFDSIIFQTGGPRPGSVVYVVLDGKVARGRVHSVNGTVGKHDEPEHPDVSVTVRTIDSDGETGFCSYQLDDVFVSPVEACNAAFGNEPEPEL